MMLTTSTRSMLTAAAAKISTCSLAGHIDPKVPSYGGGARPGAACLFSMFFVLCF